MNKAFNKYGKKSYCKTPYEIRGIYNRVKSNEVKPFVAIKNDIAEGDRRAFAVIGWDFGSEIHK